MSNGRDVARYFKHDDEGFFCVKCVGKRRGREEGRTNSARRQVVSSSSPRSNETWSVSAQVSTKRREGGRDRGWRGGSGEGKRSLLTAFILNSSRICSPYVRQVIYHCDTTSPPDWRMNVCMTSETITVG